MVQSKRRYVMIAIACLMLFGMTMQMPIGQAKEQSGDHADFDTVIKNGTIIDGSGQSKYNADVGVRNGNIARIGDLQDASADHEIDADGLFVTPGFIDPHTHATSSAARKAKSALTQGVTTEFVNSDGFGTTDLQDIFDWEKDGLGINIAPYIGFNATWKEVVGEDDRDATSKEIEDMRDIVTNGLEDGAFGVSSGLFYTPANYATTDEVIDVVSAAKDWRTNIPTHIRNENNNVIDATEEIIKIGKKAGLVPIVDHMKTMGPDNWGKSKETVGLIQEANNNGNFTGACVYPYLRSSTGLTAIVPQWVQDGGTKKMLERFADLELRPQIEKEIEETMHSRVEGPDDVYIPSKRKTLADYMKEGIHSYDGSGQMLLANLNFDYDNDNTFYFDDVKVKDLDEYSNTAFHYDFNGEDGDSWDSEVFDELHSYPGDAVEYSIENNTGKVDLDKRKQGNASAYGKIMPNMSDSNNSEALLRFRADEVGNNQRMRLWLQSDEYSSGSSMPVNGYGVELHLGTDKLTLKSREDSKTTNFGSMDADMNTDWHWLRLRADDGELSVRLWDDNEEEPDEWGIKHEIPTPGGGDDGDDEDLTPGEATMRILEQQGGSLSTIYRFGKEDDLKRIMQNSTTGICSDGGSSTSNSTHPRHYGTFTRVLGKYVREEGYLDWEEAIKKMTALTAARVGMVDRGLLAEGMKADITVFDPDTVIDKATFDNPKQYSEGIKDVLVDGKIALKDGGLTEEQAGKVLKRDANMPSRPMSTDKDIQADGVGKLLPVDSSKSDAEPKIEYSINQDYDDRSANGHFSIHDQNQGIDLQSERLGRMQETDDWQSFTGRATLNGDEERNVLVIIDKNDPFVDDQRPVVTIQVEGMDEMKGVLASQDSISAAEMKSQVEQLEKDGEFENEQAAHALKVHLIAVDHFEKKEEAEKVVKHMNGFKALIKHQKENALISEKAYNTLKMNADDLIAKWQ